MERAYGFMPFRYGEDVLGMLGLVYLCAVEGSFSFSDGLSEELFVNLISVVLYACIAAFIVPPGLAFVLACSSFGRATISFVDGVYKVIGELV